MAVRALVLAGGAGKGSYEVGALQKWIVDDGLDYHILLGNSVGCINAVKLAHAPLGSEHLTKEYAELTEWWLELDNDRVFTKRWPWGIPALWNQSVFTNGQLRQMLRERVDPDQLRNSGRKLRGVYVSWATGQLHYFDETDEHPAQKTYWSAAFPAFFEPGVDENGALFTDGGVRDIAPLGKVLELGATHVDVILTSDPSKPDSWDVTGKKTLDFAFRTVDIMSTELLLNDVQKCEDRNLLAKAVACLKAHDVPVPDELKPAEKYRPVELRVLRPSVGLGESFDFGLDATKWRLKQGYEDARNLR